MQIIKSDKISYTYPQFEEEGRPKEEPALNKVSLEIEAGSYVCILGRNGSGKSTLARHLNALLLPSEGTIFICGKNSKEAGDSNLWEIRKNVGMVFQNPDNQIVASVVEEDVAFGLENLGVPSKDIQDSVACALAEVAMEEYAKASPNNLSGGQKQRTALAGIFAMKPRCIVLDEATAMLDPRGRAEVLDTVRKLRHEHSVTVIAITHYMEEAAFADKIYVMDGGKVVLYGTPSEVFAKAEILESAGLRLPQISELARRLREKGVEIPEDVIFREDLRRTLVDKNLKR